MPDSVTGFMGLGDENTEKKVKEQNGSEAEAKTQKSSKSSEAEESDSRESQSTAAIGVTYLNADGTVNDGQYRENDSSDEKLNKISKSSKASSTASASTKAKAKADSEPSLSTTKILQKQAGDLSLSQILMIFVCVFIVAFVFLWWRYKRKMTRVKAEREAAAEELRQQMEWEREEALNRVPDPYEEKEADQKVENLPYAPEGLFYDTTDPLALDDDKSRDIADERGHHHHHQEHHSHHHDHRSHHQDHHARRHDVRSGGSDEGYYITQGPSATGFAQVARLGYM